MQLHYFILFPFSKPSCIPPVYHPFSFSNPYPLFVIIYIYAYVYSYTFLNIIFSVCMFFGLNVTEQSVGILFPGEDYFSPTKKKMSTQLSLVSCNYFCRAAALWSFLICCACLLVSPFAELMFRQLSLKSIETAHLFSGNLAVASATLAECLCYWNYWMRLYKRLILPTIKVPKMISLFWSVFSICP